MDTLLISTITVLLALILGAAAGLAAAVVVHRARRVPNDWETLTARRVVVQLMDGQTIEGLLVSRRGDLLFLREAVVHLGEERPVPADGEIVIERQLVAYLQFPTI